MINQIPQRADVFLSAELNQSRSSVAKLFDAGCVLLNNKPIKASYKLKIGDEITCNLPDAQPVQPSEYEINFNVDVLYEDEYFLIVNKPAGVATHGCASLHEASLVEWLYKQNYSLADIAGSIRAGIVHRLDKPTSGALIVAKTNSASAAISELIKEQKVERIYLAIADHSYEGECERYIARAANNRLKMRSISKEQALREFGENQSRWGRYSNTSFIGLENILVSRFGAVIAARLHSGRTHQIRSHLASLNRFIYGDELYAPQRLMKAERLMLHSFIIKFLHPFSQQEICLYAPLANEMKDWLNHTKDIDEKTLSNHILQRFGV